MDIKRMLAELNGIDIKGFEKQQKQNTEEVIEKRFSEIEDALIEVAEMLVGGGE